MAALVSVKGADAESLALSMNRIFLKLICRARTAAKDGQAGRMASVTVSSGYRLELERMQAEILDYLVRGAPTAQSKAFSYLPK